MKLAQGAEAVISRNGNVIVKDRISKGYRLPELDKKLRERRTRLEARLLREAKRAGVAVPQVIEEGKTTLKIEFIPGKKVRDSFNLGLCQKIGFAIGRLHSYDIIHGDLTTSNMIFHEGEIFLIDFGLGQQSKRDEDKATDLHLLREALESTHFEESERAWDLILLAYKTGFEGANKVIKTLSKIEKRGRYAQR